MPNKGKKSEAKPQNVEEQVTSKEESDLKVHKYLSAMFEKFSASIQKEVSELKHSIEFMSSKFDSVLLEISNMKDEIKEVKKENNYLRQENDDLSYRIHELEQYTRRDNIIINGIPDTNSESVTEIINTISTLTGAENLIHDVSVAHRLPARPGKLRPIVVRFTKRTSRDQWLKCFKDEAKKNLSYGLQTQKLCQSFQPGIVTASDHLTSYMKNIFYKTRMAAKEKGYKFVWTRDCKVYIRKNENSPVSRIINDDDLDKIV